MRSTVFGIVIAATLVIFSCPAAQETVDVPPGFLSTLRKEHPRLMLTDAGLAQLKKMRSADPVLDTYIRDVLTKADGDLTKPPLEHVLVGPRLLSVSRECLRRVYNLGMAWRLTGDVKYARACESNLLTVCAFPDWNPSHFLDVAEMTHAVGVGYDWLYNWLSAGSRTTIREGLIRHGLEPGAKAYRGEKGVPSGWIKSYHNWNQVCNGGLIAGALAVAETDSSYAALIVPSAAKSLPLALGTYAPDGAWPEGPGYWHYATRYTAYGLAALDTALGSDYGLSGINGLSVTGFFPIYTTGPTGLYINFADSGERARRGAMPCVFWLAQRFGHQFFADAEHEVIARTGAEAQHLVWYVPPARNSEYIPDLDRYFGGSVELAVFRSAWNDPDALFVGFKAGYNQVNHGHLDLGNFEMDALGVRWARDLGSDDYNLPSYWGMAKDAVRWSYYRLNSFSHNIVTLAGDNQDVMAKSTFTAFHSGGEAAHAVVDLTTAYRPRSRRSMRGVKLVGGRRAVLVQDEFDLSSPCDMTWGMTTDAAVTAEGATATLRQDGKTLRARILAPAGASFSVENAAQKSPQKRNEGVSRLVIRMNGARGNARIAVLLSPVWPGGGVVDTARIEPLSRWEQK